MRLVAAAVWLTCLLIPAAVATAVAAAQDPQQQQRPPQVSIAVTVASVRDGPETRTDVLLLWNRNVRTTPIGHGVKACAKAGFGGIVGGGLMSCTLTLHLPTGKVTASGIVHSLDRYTLVITGGTREYEGVSGPLFVRRVGDGLRRLTFTL